MGITAVKRLGGVRKAFRRDGITTYTVKFLVETDDCFVEQFAILNADGIPKEGDTYKAPPDEGVKEEELDPDAFCISVAAEEPEKDSPFHWHVTAEYSTDATEADPLEEPPIIDWDSELLSEPVITSINGEAIVNSARMPFETPPEKTVVHKTLLITRNEPDYDPHKMGQYEQTLNEKPLYDFQKGEGKIRHIKATPQEKKFRGKMVRYHRVVYTIDFRYIKFRDSLVEEQGVEVIRPWQLRKLDQGHFQLSEDETKWEPLYATNGSGVQGFLLNGEGRALDLGGSAADREERYIAWDIYETKDWSEIDIPPEDPNLEPEEGEDLAKGPPAEEETEEFQAPAEDLEEE